MIFLDFGKDHGGTPVAVRLNIGQRKAAALAVVSRDQRMSVTLSLSPTRSIPLSPFHHINRALKRAGGSFVVRHDAGDISLPNRFAIQLDAFESHEDVALVTGAVEIFGDSQVNQIRRPPTWSPRLEWELLFKNIVGAGAVMFPRVVRGTAVLFPEGTPTQKTMDWHPGSISSLKSLEQDDYMARIRFEHQARFFRSACRDR
jgi:hypothetical protein